MSHLVLINIPMSWHIFRRLLPVPMNLFMTIPRLKKSFDDDFSSTNFFWSVLLLLIRLFMTSSRPEKSFKEKVIARSRPQNIFQDGKISSSYLKNTPRLDTSFCDISSSYKCFEDNHDGVVWKHVSRRGDIIEKSVKSSPRPDMSPMTSPRLEKSFEDSVITRSRPQNIFQGEEISSKVFWRVLLTLISLDMTCTCHTRSKTTSEYFRSSN